MCGSGWGLVTRTTKLLGLANLTLRGQDVGLHAFSIVWLRGGGAALQRLHQIIERATAIQKKRIATKPSRNAKRKRMDSKNRRGRTKALRGRVTD